MTSEIRAIVIIFYFYNRSYLPQHDETEDDLASIVPH